MKKALPLLLSSALMLISIAPAQADWDRHGGHRSYDRGYDRHYERHNHRHHHDRSRWIGPAAALAIAGAVIGATAYNRTYAAPTPVYSAPPPNPNLWYYCGSSGQYYPYTNACPEGWQAVPAQ